MLSSCSLSTVEFQLLIHPWCSLFGVVFWDVLLLFLCFVFLILGIKQRALYVLGRHSIIEIIYLSIYPSNYLLSIYHLFAETEQSPAKSSVLTSTLCCSCGSFPNCWTYRPPPLCPAFPSYTFTEHRSLTTDLKICPTCNKVLQLSYELWTISSGGVNVNVHRTKVRLWVIRELEVVILWVVEPSWKHKLVLPRSMSPSRTP